ncbi:MAG TPA: zinc ribbon domain-containing protein, partial [Sarcina sp.]|nr:zinc ribbon domain-containing protein [Sarcina sp.]
MAICANCGKEIDEGAKFCTNCGAPVQHMQAPAQAEPLVPQDS